MTRRYAILAMFLSAGALCAADDLPKADTILDKFVEATGGKAAFQKLHSDIATGSMTFAAMGLSGKMVIYSQAPNKRLVEVDIPGAGLITDGTDGDVAWSMNAMQGPRLKEGDEKAETMLQSRYNGEVLWRDMIKTAETVGTESINGKTCYKLVLTPKAGKPMTRWYDKDSNLLIKMLSTSVSPMGEITVESVMSDYRKEGDVLVPHKVVTNFAGQEMTMTIDKVEQNVEIPQEKFAAPPEVKALMKK